MPQAVAPPNHPKRRQFIGLLVLIGAVAAFWIGLSARQKTALPTGIPTVRVTRATLENTRRVTGAITAERFVNVAAPILSAGESRAMVITHLVSPGAMVREGEVIGRIDPQSVLDHLDDVEAQLVQRELEIKSRVAMQAASMERLEQQLRIARANMEKALLDERTAELKPAIDREQMRLTAQEARAVYEQIRTELPLIEVQQESQLRAAVLVRDRQRVHRDRHREELRRFELRAPMSGMVVMQTYIRNGEQRPMEAGEQVMPGQPILKVVDLGSMLLDGTMNQAESELFRLGQRASVRFDAFPNLKMDGRVAAVGAMAAGNRTSGNYVRRIPLRIAIQGENPRIIPDLTASADVVVESHPDALVVPRQAIGESEGKPVVYVKQADGVFAAVEVQVGGASGMEAAIIAGLDGDEEIAAQALDGDD